MQKRKNQHIEITLKDNAETGSAGFENYFFGASYYKITIADMQKITTSALGKLLLLGEYAVVYGHPCMELGRQTPKAIHFVETAVKNLGVY